jgi:hypothetical protein
MLNLDGEAAIALEDRHAGHAGALIDPAHRIAPGQSRERRGPGGSQAVAEVAHSHASVDDPIGLRCRPPVGMAS